ncbi:MAG: Uma2 family endonuclease [Lachnospiraceae bacterium]
MPLPKERVYTIDDIYALPEGSRAELIDGKIFNMAPPSTIHQRLVMHLSKGIANYIESNNGTCEVFPAPFAVFLNDDDLNYVEPDISIICNPDKLDDKGCHGAPDWIIEITSPSNPSHDYVLKLNKYMAAGVREYWIINPSTKTSTVYYFEDGTFAQNHTFTEKIKANIYNDLEIDLQKFN